ncbi:MAG TPA: PilN domain-containing protein [Tissierellaceae bacterium]
MNDINFFESIVEKKETKINRNIVLFSIISFLILYTLGYAIYNFILITKETKVLEDLRNTVENPEISKRVEEIMEKEEELKELKEMIKNIKQFDMTIEEQDILDESLINTITSKLGENIFLTSLSIQDYQIYLVGISSDEQEIADFVKRIGILNLYEDIFVSNITQKDGYYSFSINIQLRSGDNYGKQQN